MTLGIHILFHNGERKYKNTENIMTNKGVAQFLYKKSSCLLESLELKRKADKISRGMFKE